MSRGIIDAGLFRTERVELETRASDPANPADGERWLRTDLSDTANDKLAELRLFDGSRTKSIDVVAPRSTDSGVEEVLRIKTPSGVGVIPAISPPSDAKYPSQRVRHAGENYGLGFSAIPNSVASRPADEDWADQAGRDGLRIKTKAKWSSIGAEISAKTEGPTEAILTRVSDGTDIQTVDVSNLTAGDAFTFDNVDLPADTEFDIELQDNTESYSEFKNGYTSTTAYPYTSDDVDIISRSDGSTGVIPSINNIGDTGF